VDLIVILSTLLQFLRFRFDGLEGMEIKKMKVSYTFSKKVSFTSTSQS